MIQRRPSVHSFQNDLQGSETDELQKWWERRYKRFPGIVSLVRNQADNEAQRRGVDTLVFTANDRVFRIDEKCDTYPPKNYFLEYVSVDRFGAPGWIEKPLSCDFIAYGFINHNRCDFLPWPLLQLAWQQNGELWKRTYRPSSVQNSSYQTKGVPVPRGVVWNAMYNCMSLTEAAGGAV